MVPKPKALKMAVTRPAGAKMPTPVAETIANPPVAVVARPKPAVAKAPSSVATPAPKARSGGAANVNALKKKDLIDSVVGITGGKKKAVRDVVEATLKVLGDALSKGAMLNLPPFGKAKVSRQQDGTSGKPMTVKLRRSTAVRKPKEALADAQE